MPIPYLDQTIAFRSQFAVQMLAFGCTRFLAPALANCLPWVNRVYLAVPEASWNLVCGQRIANPTTVAEVRAILATLADGERVTVVPGDWPSEQDQRNALLELARAGDHRFCLVQDADEFYDPQSWQALTTGMIAAADGAHHFTVEVIAFFRDLRYTFANENGAAAVEHFTIGIDLTAPTCFVRNRGVAGSKPLLVGGRCLHLSYVLSDEELRRKVRTWGHAKDFAVRPWVDRVWRRWHRWRVNLHPLNPEHWKFLLRYRGPWPSELQPLLGWRASYLRGSLFDALGDFLQDWLTMMRRRGRKRGSIAFLRARLAILRAQWRS